MSGPVPRIGIIDEYTEMGDLPCCRQGHVLMMGAHGFLCRICGVLYLDDQSDWFLNGSGDAPLLPSQT